MNIIGFDFGTTNSMLSYYNPETKELDCFTPNAAASSYIPTVIAYKGDDVIIGAGAVVTKNLPSDGVYTGNPAKKIMTYNEYVQKHKDSLKNSPLYGEEYTFRNKHITEEHKRRMYQALENKSGFVK